MWEMDVPMKQGMNHRSDNKWEPTNGFAILEII